MEVTILSCEERETKEGEIKYSMNVLGAFAVFAKPKLKAVDISLTYSEYVNYSTKVGEKVTIDVLIPLPDYPLRLVEKPSKAK